MNGPSPEIVELFLQEASEHLQFLREYSGILQDPYPLCEDIERLYIAAHGVAGTGGTYGYTLFHEVAGKLAHIFQYAMNATISPDATAPLVEFIYEAIAVLESDLLMISANGVESAEDIAAFKQRYPFAFPEEDEAAPAEEAGAAPAEESVAAPPVAKATPAEAAPAEAAPAEDLPTEEFASEAASSEAAPLETEPLTTPPDAAAPAAEAEEAVAEAGEAVAEAEAEEAAGYTSPLIEIPENATAPPAGPAPQAAAEFELAADAAPLAESGEEALSVPLGGDSAAAGPEAESLVSASLESTTEPLAASPMDAAELPPDQPLDQPPEQLLDPPWEPLAGAADSALPVDSASPDAILEASSLDASSEAFSEAALEAAPADDETPLSEPLAQEARPTAPQASEQPAQQPAPQSISIDHVPELEPDEELPAEILEFFVPEVEEHLQVITDCLLALEANPNQEDIHRLFRSMHTIKGSAAQVGWQRISTVAHRAEDLLGRLRDGELKPSAAIIDLCLESTDVLKKLLYRQWESEEAFQLTARTLIARLERAASAEEEEIVPDQPSSPAPFAPEPLAQAVEPAAEGEPEAAAAPVTPSEDREAPFEAVLHLEKPAGASGAPAEAASEAPLSAEAAVQAAFADHSPGPAAPSTAAGTPVGMGQSKSVRIALERLDRMMNAVGELVINRTRMLGRVEELEKLAEILTFSKGRMIDKVTEFQEKYEFSRIASSTAQSSGPWQGGGAPSQSDGFGMGSSNPGFGGWSGLNIDYGAGTPGSQGYGNSGYGSGGYAAPGYGGGWDANSSEFSELEMDRYDDFGILSRSLTEISADIAEVLTQLDGFVRRVDSDIDEFTKLAHRLQDEITQARMVPIGNLFTRITRTVRDASKATGKQVELTLAGAETELDNNIIQQIADPLLHLVRNSVAHGIEMPEERYEGGKADHGNISVRAYHRGNHIYIEVEDDGRGVDFERVKASALERGILSADEAGRMDRRELLDLLFRPGFSTSTRRTELAGRGVGLDVVKNNLTNLNGEIEIETEKGFGTRFTLKVPLTLIISQALFVQCGPQTFAFPLGFVEEIRRIRASDVEEVAGKLITKVRDVVTEVVRLDEVLQLPRLEPVNGFLRLVVVNVGGRQVGVVVEEVLRKDEIVIKNLGEYLKQVKLFPGATIAPDGSLILLVDLNRLIMGESLERRPLSTAVNASRVFQPGALAVARGEIPAAAIDTVEREKLVVLADDSISVRKFVGRMLEKAGYRVKLACDGLEALEIATSNPCDLVITDLEMPRTNGYELMMHLRQTPSTSKVPVMVVTSRAGAKHRDRALKEGAAAFMVKPVQEESFIAQVQELIGSSGEAVTAPPVLQ